MKKKIIIVHILLIISLLINMAPYKKVDAKSVDYVVKYSRKIYYGTNSKLKSFKVNQIKGSYKEYWDKKVLYKVITYPDSMNDVNIKNYTVEYYYDKNQKLVFAFAYRKVKGKLKEYRAYYGTDGKLYRYIGANGKIKDYKKGQKIRYIHSLRYEMYLKGTYYLHLCEEGFK